MERDPEIQKKNEGSPVSTDPTWAESNAMKSPVEKDDKDERRIPEHDSMVTVRLSEPPSLSVNTDLPPNTLPFRKSIWGHECTPTSATAPSATPTIEEEVTMEEKIVETEIELKTPSDTPQTKILLQELGDTTSTSPGSPGSSGEEKQSDDVDPMDESDTEEVDWDQLQKTEDEQVKDQDDNSTALLLARLEQENNKIATNPKSVKVKVVEQTPTRRPRPPSMAQMRDMVNGPTPMALRYSVLPPPPMTDLEFYMALVKDYQQTAARLPTLLSKKIRKGVPPPLRGVVWQSMAGARDSFLLEQFDRLCGESSPYEGIIGKDLGRSFPGVDMFRDPDGDGQRMLGRVLKCFSLYDQKIGYCQGLAFLVGPLLMHMPDSQAFCVLVRLMEYYDLRSCFLPDLSGLHVRIYQFRELLRQNLPTLSNHLDELQVDPAYVSQWFLSFFAVTCPLPMLFRIYDVIFAEGASETIMRVALSLMRKNESRILACTELEDVMQLLLSRGLWDCYHYNADEFVDDFVSLSSVVSREKLAQLEQGYREEKIASANAARTADVTTAASRFLGRLWTTSTSSPRSGTLSPGLTAPLRPLSMLRRSASKQSLASTLNSMEASSASVLSTVSTDATTLSRDSSNADDASIRESTPIVTKQHSSRIAADKNLHTQIEDLLTALSELQRNHALLATQLQQEREERDEDRKAVKSLLAGLKKQSTNEQTGTADDEKNTDDTTDDKTGDKEEEGKKPDEDRLSVLLEAVEGRFCVDEGQKRRSSSLLTKAQLRDELARTKDHLRIEMSKTLGFNRRIEELGQEANTLREQIRESHAHVRNLHQDKQRLERQVHTMRVRASAEPPGSSESGGWFSSGSSLTADSGTANGGRANNGLREFKLGRSKSTPNTSAFTSRSGSLVRTQTEPVTSSEHDNLVLELVQAKTAEAVARQEADEYKQKLETLRRAHGIPAETSNATSTSAMGMIGRFASTISEAGGGTKNAAPASAPTSTTPTSAGGFWGWRR
ncbi:rab-GTPase-TBC domain-containing protein [Annulohypoxylon truncatum]|uniref:rab-GTPase-TBC domain-containing protein n=1 Tax=Annulohypoxylon truncatum TaxID=327061 RepID=UPI002008B020|nr:rab-GTPase-TBC domain-containing protein [Annulohypoxylon truncatum]KAI1209887.1 rab-GTPase-TBC domain-containing protein [Annulohypoxylon truncatum]